MGEGSSFHRWEVPDGTRQINSCLWGYARLVEEEWNQSVGGLVCRQWWGRNRGLAVSLGGTDTGGRAQPGLSLPAKVQGSQSRFSTKCRNGREQLRGKRKDWLHIELPEGL